jgi:hypothetical protein
MHPHRRHIAGESGSELPRNRSTEPGRKLFLKVVGALDRSDWRDRNRHRSLLLHRVVLPIQLNRLVEARSIKGRLHVPCDGEPVLESDNRALIDPEKIAGLLTEGAVPQVAGEPVRQSKVALEARQTQRRWQIDDDEVRFRELEHGIVIVAGDRGSGLRFRRLRR